jgi:hypothetical protein
MLGQLLRLAGPVHPDDQSEVSRAAGGHTGQRVLHDNSARGFHAEHVGGDEELVRCRLPRQVLIQRRLAVDPRVEQVADAGLRQDRGAILAAGDHPGLEPGFAQLSHPGDRPGERLDEAGRELGFDPLLLQVAESPDGLRRRGVVRGAGRQGDAAGHEEVPDAVLPWLPVDVRRVVGDLEAGRGRPVGRVPLVQEHVQGAAPGRRVQRRGRCQHPVQVEQDGVEVVRGDRRPHHDTVR